MTIQITDPFSLEQAIAERDEASAIIEGLKALQVRMKAFGEAAECLDAAAFTTEAACLGDAISDFEYALNPLAEQLQQFDEFDPSTYGREG